jgi:hypothetical protein
MCTEVKFNKGKGNRNSATQHSMLSNPDLDVGFQDTDIVKPILQDEEGESSGLQPL